MSLNVVERLVVLGGKSVGKSAILRRYLFQKDTLYPSNTIEDLFLHLVKRPERWFEVEIVDTAGSEEFLELKKSWINKSKYFMIVFALDDLKSLGDAIDACALIKNLKGSRRYSVTLVGNKTDSPDRVIMTEEIHRLMGSIIDNYPYFETSALNDDNVIKLMDTIFGEMSCSNYYDDGSAEDITRKKNKPLLRKLFSCRRTSNELKNSLPSGAPSIEN